MFWALALGFISTLINGAITGSGTVMFIGILAMLIGLVLALLTRQGYSWMKIVLTALNGIGLIFTPFVLIIQFSNNPLLGFITITNCVLNIAAVVKLYQIPADWKPEESAEEEEYEETEEEEEKQEMPVNQYYEMPQDYGKLGN